MGRLRAGQESRKYGYKGSIQQVHLCQTHMLESLSDLLMMNVGGLLFPQKKNIFCIQKMVRNNRCRSNRGTALRSTNDSCLLGNCRSGLGAHTSLDWVRG